MPRLATEIFGHNFGHKLRTTYVTKSSMVKGGAESGFYQDQSSFFTIVLPSQLSTLLPSLDTVAGSCDPKAAEIIGGNYTLLEDGTTLIYECPQGQYPHPTQFRFCKDDNHWSPLKGRDGGIVEQAVCQGTRWFISQQRGMV